MVKYPTVQGVPPYKPDQGGTPWNPGCLGEARQSLAFIHVRTEATPSTREGTFERLVSGQYRGAPRYPLSGWKASQKGKRVSSRYSILKMKYGLRLPNSRQKRVNKRADQLEGTAKFNSSSPDCKAIINLIHLKVHYTFSQPNQSQTAQSPSKTRQEDHPNYVDE